MLEKVKAMFEKKSNIVEKILGRKIKEGSEFEIDDF